MAEGLNWGPGPDSLGQVNVKLKRFFDIIQQHVLLLVSTVGTSPVTGDGAVLLSSADTLVLVDTSGGPVTLTLPSAVTVAGYKVIFKVVDGTDNVTVVPFGSETIDGFPSSVFATECELVSVASGWIEL